MGICNDPVLVRPKQRSAQVVRKGIAGTLRPKSNRELPDPLFERPGSPLEESLKADSCQLQMAQAFQVGYCWPQFNVSQHPAWSHLFLSADGVVSPGDLGVIPALPGRRKASTKPETKTERDLIAPTIDLLSQPLWTPISCPPPSLETRSTSLATLSQSFQELRVGLRPASVRCRSSGSTGGRRTKGCQTVAKRVPRCQGEPRSSLGRIRQVCPAPRLSEGGGTVMTLSRCSRYAFSCQELRSRGQRRRSLGRRHVAFSASRRTASRRAARPGGSSHDCRTHGEPYTHQTSHS